MNDEQRATERIDAFQWRTESMSHPNHKIMQIKKRKRKDLKAKNKLNKQLLQFYEKVLFRKMKWRHYVYTRKCRGSVVKQRRQSLWRDSQKCIRRLDLQNPKEELYANQGYRTSKTSIKTISNSLHRWVQNVQIVFSFSLKSFAIGR
jgi:hypothetical protein